MCASLACPKSSTSWPYSPLSSSFPYTKVLSEIVSLCQAQWVHQGAPTCLLAMLSIAAHGKHCFCPHFPWESAFPTCSLFFSLCHEKKFQQVSCSPLNFQVRIRHQSLSHQTQDIPEKLSKWFRWSLQVVLLLYELGRDPLSIFLGSETAQHSWKLSLRK